VHSLIRKAIVVVIVASLTVLVIGCSNSSEPQPKSEPPPSPTAEGPFATVGTSDPVATATTPSEQPPLAPVFAVSNIDGESVRLEDLLGAVPVYLVFMPSTTDELDIDQLKKVQSRIEQFKKMDAEVVVVVSELPTQVIDSRDELGLDFSLIADPLNVVASDWQVFDLDNDGKSSPASFVFDAHGNLIARLVASEPDDRPSIDEVLNVIEESLSVGAA
jgi:peroxiredoxin